MARTAKQWESLSPSYRERLTRGGISKASYMRGDNLQAARGQAIEHKRATRHKPGESPSVVRSWRARALKRGVTREDWNTAISTSPFWQVKNAVVGMEQAHQQFRERGAPNSAIRKQLRKEHKYNAIEVRMANAFVPPATDNEEVGDVEYYDDGYADNEEWNYSDMLYEEVEEPMEWGDSWGFYH